MPDLFGTDIAGIINDAMGGELLAGELRKKGKTERDPENPTGGTSTQFGGPIPFRGFFEEKSEVYVNGTLVSIGGQTISILGGSLPIGVRPEVGDLVSIEEEPGEFIILKIGRDPAAAMFTCKVESA